MMTGVFILFCFVIIIPLSQQQGGVCDSDPSAVQELVDSDFSRRNTSYYGTLYSEVEIRCIAGRSLREPYAYRDCSGSSSLMTTLDSQILTHCVEFGTGNRSHCYSDGLCGFNYSSYSTQGEEVRDCLRREKCAFPGHRLHRLSWEFKKFDSSLYFNFLLWPLRDPRPGRRVHGEVLWGWHRSGGDELL